MVITVSICNPWNLQTPISHVHLGKTLGRTSERDHTSQWHVLRLGYHPPFYGNSDGLASMKCPLAWVTFCSQNPLAWNTGSGLTGLIKWLTIASILPSPCVGSCRTPCEPGMLPRSPSSSVSVCLYVCVSVSVCSQEARARHPLRHLDGRGRSK